MSEVISSTSELKARHGAGLGYVYCDTQRIHGSTGDKARLHRASCGQVLRMRISSDPDRGHRLGTKRWWATLQDATRELESEHRGEWTFCGICQP